MNVTFTGLQRRPLLFLEGLKRCVLVTVVIFSVESAVPRSVVGH